MLHGEAVSRSTFNGETRTKRKTGDMERRRVIGVMVIVSAGNDTEPQAVVITPTEQTRRHIGQADHVIGGYTTRSQIEKKIQSTEVSLWASAPRSA